jgi:hypothetical protein
MVTQKQLKKNKKSFKKTCNQNFFGKSVEDKVKYFSSSMMKNILKTTAISDSTEALLKISYFHYLDSMVEQSGKFSKF